MRQIVRAALPLGKGVILDPFMGAGSTVAAAQAVGYESIGIEVDSLYFRIAEVAIPRLAALSAPLGSPHSGRTVATVPAANGHKPGRSLPV